MKLFLLIFGVASVLVIDARNVQDSPSEATGDTEKQDHFMKHINDHTAGQRHKRRSRQSEFGYRNQYPFDYGRRDYDWQENALLGQILNKLDEISANMRTPPPPPPPVYVPYPVPYAVPRYRPCRCGDKNNTTFENRFTLEDPRQNWGFVEYPFEMYPDFDGDGNKPISLKPLQPVEPTTRRPIQPSTTEAPPPPPVSIPGECQAAILSCCSSKQQEKCFVRYGCVKTYKTGIACLPQVIKSVINQFAEIYAPE